MISAIILGAGKSERFGEKKIFKTLKGIKVIDFSISKFLKVGVDLIILAFQKEDQDSMQDIISKYKYAQIVLTEGGKTRWQSFENSFLELRKKTSIQQDDILIEHDAARPLFSVETLLRFINELKKNPAIEGIIPFITPVETVRTIEIKKYETSKESIYEETIFLQEIPRNNVALIQTPQVFRAKAVEKLLDGNKEEFADLAGIFFRNKRNIIGLPGDRRNIKITYKEDLHIAEALVSDEEIEIVREMRTEKRT
ncbi:MAG: 2-C-methyl-D-erythritol 4-phosphate cytidylyltransferase [Candidatus Calescibacterium sp.]|nr:2-C-methyl-D-erythritol 4-phosphate cytidylyltransferase [Candidatus Calescibacterium sp.]MCX7733467.1 2-C-methyl-D-erythritol 4-phosphate cytidylyltransferase [bacterium]MDW8087448.1 2-C-methyl-D-erythritol 4-phosphate cytidylyltransferase [Candidatus Calescibacterium sp.]